MTGNTTDDDATATTTTLTPEEAVLAAIARRILAIPTLTPRGCDRLDFHEVSVLGLKDALLAAYRAGQQAAR